MASNSNNLYVTFVDVHCNLLKVWGQKNRISASYIERQLFQLIPELNDAQSLNPRLIRPGLLCYAKSSGENYFRARIMSNVQGNSVEVLFVDFGNRNMIHISNIKLREGTEDVLLKMVEQADDFYLARVIAPAGGWTNEIIDAIRNDICYKELPYTEVAQKFIEIQFRNEEFSSYLVLKEMAQKALPNVQSQIIIPSSEKTMTNSSSHQLGMHISMLTSPSPQSERIINSKSAVLEKYEGQEFQEQMGGFKKSVTLSQPHSLRYSSLATMSPTQYDANRTSQTLQSHYNLMGNSHINENSIQGSNLPLKSLLHNQYNSIHSAEDNAENVTHVYNNNMIEALAQQLKLYIAEGNIKPSQADEVPHNYVSSAWKVGSTHNVFISYVDDGPWSFSIQLVANEDELNKLMEEIAYSELVPIKFPIVLGHPCIAASVIYGNQCRGVIVSISHSAAKVYLVDFGDIEELPIFSIYELPQRFFKTKVLSQKFCLTGLQNVPYSKEVKELFKEVVQDMLLILKVSSLDESNLPSCELYYKNKNIKRILNEKIQIARMSANNSDVKEGDIESIIVTWIYSLQSFYVQLHKRATELNSLKDELDQIDVNGKKIMFDELEIGLPCICKYIEDGQWYRAKIVSFTSEKNITVFYVDFGNSEEVDITLLRKVDNTDLITQLKSQALRCCLYGFETKPYDQELSFALKNLALEKELNMEIVTVNEDQLLVKLFDGEENLVPLLFKFRQDAAYFEKNDSDLQKTINYSGKTGLSDKDKAEFPSNSESYERNNLVKISRQEKNENWKSDKDIRSEEINQFHFTDESSKEFKHEKENRRFNDRNYHGSDWKVTKNSDSKRKYLSKNKSNYDPKPFKKNSKEGSQYQNETGKPHDERNRRIKTDNAVPSPAFENPFKKSERQNKTWLEASRSNDSLFAQKNKYFSNPVDGNSLFNKENHLKKRQSIKKDDLPTPGSRFKEKVVNIVRCYRSVITYYINPHEFYIQILSDEAIFKKMMHDIQIYYSDKHSISQQPRENDIVIAQFSYDNMLYRGEVITSEPLIIRYVDYGNQEEVEQRKSWPVAKQFLNLPKQAVKCRLANVGPSGKEWPPLGSELDAFFEYEEYKCTFLDFINDTYEVKIESIEDGKCIASKIIDHGFGVAERKPLVIPKIDFSLLAKQVLRLRVTYVESSKKFFVILNHQFLEKINQELGFLAGQVEFLKHLKESTFIEKTLCLVREKNASWVRGRIIAKDENKFSVRLIDSGNIANVAIDEIGCMPEHLQRIQPQAVECSLIDTPDCVAWEDLKNLIYSQDLLVSVVSVINESLWVNLFDKKGFPLFSKKTKGFQSVDPIGQLPIFYQKKPVAISYFESPMEIYIRCRNDESEIVELTAELRDFYETNTEKSTFEGNEGDLVAAKTSPGYWCRGRVLGSSSTNTWDIFCIDTGKKEKLPRENVKKLDISFYRFHAFVRKVALDLELKSKCLDEVNKKLESLMSLSDEMFGYFVNFDGNFTVELIINDKRFTSTLVSDHVVLPAKDKFQKITSANKINEIISGAKIIPERATNLKVFVIHIDSPNKFWIHKESSINDFQEFQETLQKTCETLPIKENPQVDDVVAVMVCNVWYRAVIIKVPEKVLTVQFIDYGNIVDIDLTNECVRQLTIDLISVEPFATQFSLKGTWKENATSLFEEIIMQCYDPVTAVILENGSPVVVDLLKDGLSISAQLTEAGRPASEGDGDVVYISHINSPDDFYVQRYSSTETLENISRKLMEIERSQMPSSEIEENEIYAAKYMEDGVWYRAKILGKHAEHIQVYFIDYGNVSNVREVEILSQDLAEIPPLCENYSLLLGEKHEDWSEKACNEFDAYADGRPLKMEVVVHNNSKPVVNLFYGNQNIGENLAMLCEGDGRFEVYVSHVVSVHDFYIKPVNDDAYELISKALHKIPAELEDLVHKEHKILCLAQDPVDNTWHRARILRMTDSDYEVILVDLGKTIITDKLKKATDDLATMPERAIRCSLHSIDANMAEKVKERFMQMTVNNTQVFRARIIRPGEVNVVSLKQNGLILEEVLLNAFKHLKIEAKNQCEVCCRPAELSLVDATNSDRSSEDFNPDIRINDNSENQSLSESLLQNETDEEKQIKIRMTNGHGQNTPEGFKSDDEKRIPVVLSGHFNVTDSDLMEKYGDSYEEIPEEGPGAIDAFTDSDEPNPSERFEVLEDSSKVSEQYSIPNEID